ncbi:MAG: class I SAM-dependent methyltransferase [Bacillota bacterium]
MSVNHVELKDMIRKRWNRRAGSFDRCPGHGIHSDREKNDWVNLFTRVIGGDGLSILDVGAGTGVLALVMAEMGHRITCLDIAEEMLEKAGEKFKNNNLPGKFVVGDAEKLPFEDNSFDVVFNRHVVWSLPDPDKAIREWKRVLKAGGKLVIIDGNWGKHLPMHKKIWRFFGQLLILITEFRNPWQGGHKMDRYLPMKQQKRPETDKIILEGLGFQVDVINVNIPRWNNFLGYLKHGYYTGEEFLIKAVKTTGCCIQHD